MKKMVDLLLLILKFKRTWTLTWVLALPRALKSPSIVRRLMIWRIEWMIWALPWASVPLTMLNYNLWLERSPLILLTLLIYLMPHILIMFIIIINPIMLLCMQMFTIAHFAAAKATLVSFVMIDWISITLVFGSRKLTLPDPKERGYQNLHKMLVM